MIAGLIKLNTNENPYPPSPAAVSAIKQAANEELRLYPDPDSRHLKQAIADLHGLPATHIFVGNGSDEVLAHTFHALLKHEMPVLFPDVSYSFYPVYCQLYGIKYTTIPVDSRYQIRVDDYRRPNGGIVLPNPNAPTGCALGRADIRRLVQNNPDSVVVIDEAYVDFGAETAVPLIRDCPNLLVIQTMSKSRSLAGLRVGFALGQPSLIQALELVKGSFNSYPMDRLAIAGATAAIQDHVYFDQTRTQVMATREWLTRELHALGFDVLPSAANFVFARHPSYEGLRLYEMLRDRKILVRHFQKPRIEQFLRITVGTDEECQPLISALREIRAVLDAQNEKSGEGRAPAP